jgi:hypothetical protein
MSNEADKLGYALDVAVIVTLALLPATSVPLNLPVDLLKVTPISASLLLSSSEIFHITAPISAIVSVAVGL